MSTFVQMVGRVMDYTHRPKNQDDTEVRALVNEAYVFVASEFGTYQKTTAALPLTVADGDYSIVNDLGVADFSTLRIVKYTAANGSLTLGTVAPTTPDEITALRQLNPSATSPSVAYAVQGWDGLMLHPLPATGDTLTITYGAVPAALSDNTDVPSRIPQEWHHLIVTRAAAVAMEVMDDQRAILLQRQYEHELGRARLWLANSKGTRGFAPAAASTPVIWPSDTGTSFAGV